MARKVPGCPIAPDGALEASGKWASYSINIVTPLFGGGPVPEENDPVTLIRGSSIRGHLRSWWRATRGASLKVEQLRQREGEIWGTAESPSPVQLWVSEVVKGEVGPWAAYNQDPRGGGVKSTPTPTDSDYPRYALFPFQGDTEKEDGVRIVKKFPATVTKNISFKLNLRWPANMDALEVEASVWAWVNFGGLGARTRRGCGSLYCESLSPAGGNLNDIQQWYSGQLERYGVFDTSENRPWPTLPGQLLISYSGENQGLKPTQAWSQVIKLLERFRQGLNIGRGPGSSNRPGRSYWPEADSLRRVTGHSLPAHSTPGTTKDNAFPRAEFGLPIIFHFKDGPKGSRDISGRDPADRQLLPAVDTERMASPLILKALTVGPDQAVPMILRLKTKLPDGVVIKRVGTNGQGHSFGSDQIRRPDLSLYQNSPMKGHSQAGSALEAFIHFAVNKGGFK